MSDKHEYVKEEANTPNKMVREAFDFADRLFAHLDHLQLDLADEIDFGCSYNFLAYPFSPFETVRVTFHWLNRPWLDDATVPVGDMRYPVRSYGIPTFNKDLRGQDEQGRWIAPNHEDAMVRCEDPYTGWYLSAVPSDGSLYLHLPRCVLQSAKYLRKVKALLRQPAWFGGRTDITGYCTYTSQWFAMLKEDGGNPAPELFNPEAHYWWTADRPYVENPGRSVVPQAAIGFGSLMCCKGAPDSHGSRFGHFRADEALWKLREYARLAKGVYNPLPARVIEALDMDKLEFAYPHLAVGEDHQGMIAYTRDEAAGIRDRQLVMKPGRFIKQFARNPEFITDDEVKYLAAEACGTVEIKFRHTRDRKEYSRVYQRGPQSCMAYGPLAADTFDGDHLLVDGEFVHPTEVYAHPENSLELVYGVLGSDDIVSRTLVNTKKKLYCSIYVKDSPASARQQMEQYLKAKGFKNSSDVLVGEKLLLIETDDRSIISPYLDPSNVGVKIDRENNCLVAGEGSEGADHSTGTLNNYTCGSANDWSCVCCSDNFEEDESYQLDIDGDRICLSCADEHYVEAYVTASRCTYHILPSHNTVYSCTNVDTGELANYSYVLFNSHRYDINHYGCVELDRDRYEDNDMPMIANHEDCVSDDDDNWVLRDDVEQYDLFIDPDGDAHRIDEWVAVTEEDGTVTLAELDDIDEELYDQSPAAHEDWPMLNFFILRAQPDDEDEGNDDEDEAVNALTANEDEYPDQSVA